MAYCEHCTQGYILSGEPTGSMEQNGAYFHPGTSADSKTAVVLLTDIFGLPLKNSKIMADKFSETLGCDVWVPNVFGGAPPVTVEQLQPYMSDTPGKKKTFVTYLRFAGFALTNIWSLLKIRPAVVVPRVSDFIKHLKEEKKYEKIGIIGYCLGGTIGIPLAGTTLVDSAVIAHPGPSSEQQIRDMRVPTLWLCAEEDDTFSPQKRQLAEKIFADRKDKPNYIDYEFKDYKGTVHGYAIRPNLAIPVVKEAFENSFQQSVSWFQKTLNL